MVDEGPGLHGLARRGRHEQRGLWGCVWENQVLVDRTAWSARCPTNLPLPLVARILRALPAEVALVLADDAAKRVPTVDPMVERAQAAKTESFVSA